MCCFSNTPALEQVSGTRIFARFTRPHRQVIAYSMTVAARADLAMILPLPVPADSFEDAVRFINLEGYAAFFDDLESGFPRPLARGRSRSIPAPEAKLKVHTVGAFEASFVPKIADFSRLDPRFTIDASVWEALPEYADYGFAVFKLRAAAGLMNRMLGRPTSKTIHPMAFSFPTRRPDALFFPTVHIHDGAVHPRAAFDHTLYCQLEDRAELEGWRTSTGPAEGLVDVARTSGLVDGPRVCLRRGMTGMLENADTWVDRWG